MDVWGAASLADILQQNFTLEKLELGPRRGWASPFFFFIHSLWRAGACLFTKGFRFPAIKRKSCTDIHDKETLHKRFCHSQFCQFGSRKGRNDSNEFDPSGSISFTARDSAQACRCWAWWIPFSAAMRWMCIKWNLNGSNTQMTYESYDINPKSGSGADNIFWPLHESRALGMDAEGWTLPNERNLEQDVSANIYFESPRCHTSMRFLHSATTEASWTKHENWSQIGFTLKRRQHHTCLYSHLGVGENVNDSVLIGPSFVSTYRNLSKHCLSAWHTRSNFPREALAYGIVLLFQAV